MAAKVAGIDSSTQSCKVVIREAKTGELRRQGAAKHPGGTEIDPHFWWEALTAAVKDAGGLHDVDAAAIAGQQHGLIALDHHGRIIRDALLWNDTRSAQAATDLILELGDADLGLDSGSGSGGSCRPGGPGGQGSGGPGSGSSAGPTDPNEPGSPGGSPAPTEPADPNGTWKRGGGRVDLDDRIRAGRIAHNFQTALARRE